MHIVPGIPQLTKENFVENVTRALNHWLAKHNIPATGVKIIIEFPERRHAEAAEVCIQLDLEPMIQYRGGNFGRIETMNGLGLSLRAAAR